MTHQSTHDGAYKVQLSIEGHEYAVELRCDGDDDWTLLSINVEGIAEKPLNWKASSCAGALVAAETVARQILGVVATSGDRLSC